MSGIVYALVDPVTHVVRYIGKSGAPCKGLGVHRHGPRQNTLSIITV